MKPFDTCIITAANELQAQGYRKQLQWRREKGLLPQDTAFLVLSDPKGNRVGSGSSTIYVLSMLLQEAGSDFDRAFSQKRILILHSGGDSRRLPAYSAIGKIFVPLPTARFFALFDVMLDNYMNLPSLPDGQVIVASGDVVLNFDSSLIAFSHTGITGVTYPDDDKVAAHHGVYVFSAEQREKTPKIVGDFLQKPSKNELEKAGARDLAGRAMIDTGIMNFALDAVRQLISSSTIVEKIGRGELYLDLYEQIVFAVLGRSSRSEIEYLKKIPFFASVLPYCGFFHIGTSLEFLNNFYTLSHAGVVYEFENFTRSQVRSRSELQPAFVFNSSIDSQDIAVEEPAIIEGCCLQKSLRLKGRNIITGIPAQADAIALPEGICLTILPVDGNESVAVLYGIEDNFKWDTGNPECTFLNESFAGWLDRRRISGERLWRKDDPQDLWHARLFPRGGDPASLVRVVMSLLDEKVDLSIWDQSERLSMQGILHLVDHERILANHTEALRLEQLKNVESELRSRDMLSSDQIVSWCRTEKEAGDLLTRIGRQIDESSDFLFKARLKKLQASLYTVIDPASDELARLEDEAYSLVLEAVRQHAIETKWAADAKLAIRSDEVVWICTPARLDFAGGWSDTPPYCFNYGGIVLNAAVKLNGQYPIQVIGKRYSEPVLRINSIDLGAHHTIRTMAELLAFTDPSDWLSLPKSAFIAAGTLPSDPDADLQKLLKRFGGGIDLTLFSALPSGSGLGTSSILGSSIIACIAAMFGFSQSREDLFRKTLYMEQLMTTGGGWQDQIGGVVGGVKLIRTEKGLLQDPNISWTDLKPPDMAMSDRFLLYYTGYRRMAKNILRQIVARVLDRNPVTLETVLELKTMALAIKDSLDQRQLDEFGDRIARVWELNKQLDSGSSTPEIEDILARIAPHIRGAKLLGAGGGGFLFIVTRGKQASQKVREILIDDPPNDRARFFSFEVDPQGLQTSVL